MKTFVLEHLKLFVALCTLMPMTLMPAAAQSEGQALHVFVGRSVVINLQSPVTRILSSNPAVIDTLATSFGMQQVIHRCSTLPSM
jgi:Flp pilus assembly secretin CpaC